MNRYQRPWWVWALRLPTLETTLQEDHHPGHKRFIIEGEPQFKSLTWITYGPALAIVAVGILGSLAWTLEIRQQPVPVRVFFVCLTVLLPILFWVVGSVILNGVVEHALQQEATATKERVELDLDLAGQTLQVNRATPIAFDAIADFRLMSDSGVYYEPQEEIVPLLHLVMETNQGQITLLKQALGTVQQKLQLTSQLRALTGQKRN